MLVWTLPALSVAVAVQVMAPTPFAVPPEVVTLHPSASTPEVASVAVQLMPVASPSL